MRFLNQTRAGQLDVSWQVTGAAPVSLSISSYAEPAVSMHQP
jgi:hypothetical protein